MLVIVQLTTITSTSYVFLNQHLKTVKSIL
ncbi:reduced hepatic glutathione transporter with canalicular features [Escherichia coli P12b]|nr:reduced hepatic glutathione transporter with canalicular features [Escherichia coli P12b]